MRRATELVQGVAYRFVARARSSLGIQRAANFRRLEVAFVLPLGDEAHNYMTKLQVEILRRNGVNEGLAGPPHITLKLGFKATDLDVLADYVDEIARTTPPLDIRMSQIDSFEEGIIFLDVEPNAELDQLRRKIVRELEERFGVQPRPLEGDQFRFHATLAYGLPKRRFEKELANLSSEKPTFRFEARTILMLCHTGNQWITYRRAALGSHVRENR